MPSRSLSGLAAELKPAPALEGILSTGDKAGIPVNSVASPATQLIPLERIGDEMLFTNVKSTASVCRWLRQCRAAGRPECEQEGTSDELSRHDSREFFNHKLVTRKSTGGASGTQTKHRPGWARRTIRFALVALAVLWIATPPAQAVESGQFKFEHGGRERGYWLQVPPAYDGHKQLPLVIVFHGAGGEGKGTARATLWNDKADHEGFLVVAPDGTPAFPEREANFRTNPRLWNDGSGRGAMGRLNIDDVGFIAALLDDLQQRLSIDPRRIYATGFSNGAGMTFNLASKLSTRLAAVAPVASHCWLAEPHLERAIPTLYMIGTADPLVPYEGGEVRSPWGGAANKKPPVSQTLEKWAHALGCPDEPKTVSDSDGVKVVRYGPGRDGSELLAYTIEGQGHHWPGGRGQLPESIVGKNLDKLNATDVIWSYFAAHPLPATSAEASAQGPRVDRFSLSDPQGKLHQPSEWQGAKAVVLLFLGTECPISNGYAPEMARLASDFGSRGVLFYGIHCDPDVTAKIASEHAREFSLEFPLLLDPQQILARQTGAGFTPEAVLLNSAGDILYRGRIDDRYAAPGKQRAEPTSRDLQAAIEAVLAGQKPAVSQTQAVGCPLPKAAPASGR